METLELATRVEQKYRQYLETTFYFKDPELRASFGDALSSQHLSRGPFLEATPVFKRTLRASELIAELLGTESDKQIDGFAMALDLLLYEHQEHAIRGIAADRNVVVATGTGSGKTEAFLYPIFLHLFKEWKSGSLGAGIRAVVLYPMNALANDQRERLGEYARRFSETDAGFHFTFGQYTGETPEDLGDRFRHAADRQRSRLPGEIVFRSQMRETPPHILLTNYSMLEYLLLRPDDSPLFDKDAACWWKFLILDEAHQYRGSRGIEMAMLLARLKQRLREGGRTEPFRCVATSATLLRGKEDREAVAQFASDLFGEPFSTESVLLARPMQSSVPSSKALTQAEYRSLADLFESQTTERSDILRTVAMRLQVSQLPGEAISSAVGLLLAHDQRSAMLRTRLAEGPCVVSELANELFPDAPPAERITRITQLVGLLLKADDPASGAPLLAARYHLFLRSLEGAFICYSPKRRVVLDRGAENAGARRFEVALCRECGQHYLVGRVRAGFLQEPIRDPAHDEFGATYFRPIESQVEIDEADGHSANRNPVYQLCVECGMIGRAVPDCAHDSVLPVVKEDAPKDEDRKDEIARCGACGYSGAGRDPVHEVVHGSDGPHAVIATTLYNHLSEAKRKILAFADGRQDAAFFAWYLQNSTQEILVRNLLYRAASDMQRLTPNGVSLAELAAQLRDLLRHKGIIPASAGDAEALHEAWRALYREFLSDQPRVSLEGVGLVYWRTKLPESLEIPRTLMQLPWALEDDEARDLVALLLDSCRLDDAVELRSKSALPLKWSDLNLQSTQLTITSTETGQLRKDERKWAGPNGRRMRFLKALLKRISPQLSEVERGHVALSFLRELWDALLESDKRAVSPADRLFVPVNDGRRINPDWWRLHLIDSEDTLFKCILCGRLQGVGIRAVCPRSGCEGILEKVHKRRLHPNHYRDLYLEEIPGALRVEEHTAQLNYEKAREFQADFRSGRIHVLSCSTTFELGVDLGDLDTVFLRNVPPETFNFAQRAGRSGRRSGSIGFVVTYCRRSPHDLYHFSRPEAMLSGKARPPVLRVANEKIISRHITATALSEFFRKFPERFRKVREFTGDLAAPTAVSDFREFLQNDRRRIEERLRLIVPSEIHSSLGLYSDNWIDRIAGRESRFAISEALLSSDYRKVKELERQFSDLGQHTRADWAKRRGQDIAGEDVLTFLSRRAVIPKYGFPVDVVELDTHGSRQGEQAREVSLQRDLAIAVAEFAPTSSLIAQKKEWRSYGLKLVPERALDRRWYVRCAVHGVFNSKTWEGEQASPLSAGCCDKATSGQFLDPKFGFVTSYAQGPREPKRKPSRVFTTRPYFAGFKESEPDELQIGSVFMTPVSPGTLVVLCEGRRGEGFFICAKCGAGFRKAEPAHETPFGLKCGGELTRSSLGHEFLSDVLKLRFTETVPEGVDPVWFGYSLAYALVEGASEELQVPATDLSATVAYGGVGSTVPPIILYDNVPGGAGLVARLQEPAVLRSSLQIALDRVSGECGCAELESCYGCLRHYRNQFAHPHLQRGPVRDYLGTLLSQWPEQMGGAAVRPFPLPPPGKHPTRRRN